MTPQEFRTTRRLLGLSSAQMGAALEFSGDPGRTVRQYESGRRPIPGPVAVAMRLFSRNGLDRVAGEIVRRTGKRTARGTRALKAVRRELKAIEAPST